MPTERFIRGNSCQIVVTDFSLLNVFCAVTGADDDLKAERGSGGTGVSFEACILKLSSLKEQMEQVSVLSLASICLQQPLLLLCTLSCYLQVLMPSRSRAHLSGQERHTESTAREKRQGRHKLERPHRQWDPCTWPKQDQCHIQGHHICSKPAT